MATLLTLAYVTSFEALYESTFHVLRNDDDEDAATRRLLTESPLAPYLNPARFASKHDTIPIDAFQQAMSDYSQDCGNMRMANLPQWKQDVQRVKIFAHYMGKFLV